MINTAIVVLHYANNELTNKCIESIMNNTAYATYHIIIVDNNSPEPYILVHKYDSISLIRNNDRGSVSGINFGLYHALYNLPFDIKYVVNFDNDIICLDNWLPPLISCMESDPTIGIVGGKQWDKDQKTFRSVGMDLTGGHLYGNMPNERSTAVWIQASAVMMRAEMMKLIGLHDTRFTTYCSDSDYCIHANDRGWKVVFEPESNVIHIMNASYGGFDENTIEDQRKLLQKWFGLKFNALASIFPIDSAKKQYGQVTLKVEER